MEAIASHIASDSTFYANAVVRRIVTLAKSLADFPLAGRKVPEFDDETIRELLAHSYRIIYLVEQRLITIAAVIHGKRLV